MYIINTILDKCKWQSGVNGSNHQVTVLKSEFTQQDGKEEEEGKTLVCDKHDRAVTCVFCRDLHLTLLFSGL